MLNSLKDKVINNYEVKAEDVECLINADLETLCNAANQIREHFCGNSFDICTIINGKSGRCSENCKFCAQSSHYKAKVEKYPLLRKKIFLDDAVLNCNKGILRYSIVTSGRNLTDEEVNFLCEIYEEIQENSAISLCASHGLLTEQQFEKLKKSGVKRYHNNLETSRRYFDKVCTTHTYDDKVLAIKNARKAGLEICSGGIIGLGETMQDRIDMAFELKKLVVKSVPINILNPIKGTPFGDLEILPLDEVRRTIAIFRFILPDVALRLAGGRGLLLDKGKSIFISGANAAISGDMLTTAGISVIDDMKMVKSLGFEVKML